MKLFGVSLSKFATGIILLFIYPVMFMTFTYFVTYSYYPGTIANTTSTTDFLVTSFYGLLILLPIAIPLIILFLKYFKVCDERIVNISLMYYFYQILFPQFVYLIGDYYETKNFQNAVSDLSYISVITVFGLEGTFVIAIIMTLIFGFWISRDCEKIDTLL